MCTEDQDPYWKLRPEAPTPKDEICSCSGKPSIILRGGLGPNPLACIHCNLEVPPESVGFNSQLSKEIACWSTFHDCFWHLWLESGEFENWAFDQLSDLQAPVNRRGLDLTLELGKIRPAYYWWFQDVGRVGFAALRACPACARELTRVGWALGCEVCKIFVANEGV